MERDYLIGFRDFKKMDEKRIFDITNKKGIEEIIEFFDIIDCDRKVAKEMLKELNKKDNCSGTLRIRLRNCWIDYFIRHDKKCDIRLSAIQYTKK